MPIRLARLRPARAGALLALVLTGLAPRAPGTVVINEILYHAPDDLDDLQFIELHNPDAAAADLGGWTFSKGIRFSFPAGTRLAPGGFLVLCRNTERFHEFHQVPIAGVFATPLSHKSGRIELTDATGHPVDSVRFGDDASWPAGADGSSGSLERISPAAAGDDPANWISSPLSEDRNRPGGTPGRANAGYSAALPPIIRQVKFTPKMPAPNQPVLVEAELRDPGDPRTMELLYRLAGPGFEKPETAIAMTRIAERRYSATIPGQAADQLIRFRVRATAANGALRWFPAETEPRPALSAWVPGPIEPALIPFGWILRTTESEFKAAQQQANAPEFVGFLPPGFPGFGPGEPPPPDPLEETRDRARTRLERELDLSVPWFELTALGDVPAAALPELREVFRARLPERNRFIEDFLARAKSEAELQVGPEMVREFLSGITEGIRARGGETSGKAFTDWLDRSGRQPSPPFARMINNRLDLEGAWHAVTLNAEPDPARLTRLRGIFRESARERQGLLAEMAAGQGRDSAFRDQRDRAATLSDQLVTALKPELSPEQTRQLDAWRNVPREITVGLRSEPGGGPFPPPGFGGPPGGPGGPGGPGRPGGPMRVFGPGGPGGPFGPRGFMGRSEDSAAGASHRSAFVYFDPATRKTELFDFVQVTERKGGQKVHFVRDQLLQGMSSISLIFEGEVASIVEPLAYEVYRRAGLVVERSFPVRLWQSGQPVGYHLLIEQPNRAFLRFHQLRDDGNLYKLIWFGDGLVGQHEKKTNMRTGHDDLVALIAEFERTGGEAQWEMIRRNFDVDAVAGYFAVNMALSHWDGFFNNYFTYHDVHGTGRWTMFPWDQDQTWGIAMGMPGVFHDMPLNFGMNGAEPPGEGPGGGFGGGWWRPPGWFSGPLLANPQFRKVFLTRTRDILEKVCTPEVFGPILDDFERRLEPEVRVRAAIRKHDPEGAVREFREILAGRREHLRLRREFLLGQEELRKLPR